MATAKTFNQKSTIVRGNGMDRLISRKCDQCRSPQPVYVYHCPSCNRCVAYMDHHCPWINNCVGYFNQKPFLLFTFYATLCLGYGASALTTMYSRQLYGATALSELSWTTGVLCISVTLQWLGFLFTLTVMLDQVVVIFNRFSLLERVNLDLDRLKDGLVKKRGHDNWCRAMGEQSVNLWWLLPVIH